jgi:sulfotransferase 6B1
MKRAGFLWLPLIRFANKRTKNIRALRRAGIWFYLTLVRTNVFLPPPRVILLSPPKSGTHLLSDCLALMPRMMFSGRRLALPEFYATSKPNSGQSDPSKAARTLDENRIRRYLGGCPQGMFVTTHARFHPSLRDLIRELEFKQILLLRDPRDVVVSNMFFTKEQPDVQYHKYYSEVLNTDEERIMATIRGFGQHTVTDHPRASIREMFEGYTPWLEDPSTLVIRFEDLIGPRGGGVSRKQLDEIKRIADFVERPISKEHAQQLAQNMYSRGSLTYRKGIIGDWQNHFTEDHRRVFKQVAGDILIRLGYEKNTDW